jgi:protein-tyrosine phosphatase
MYAHGSVIDLHSHVLPGVDDGARSLEESLEIAQAAVADGIEVLAATPHVRDDFPTSAEAVEGGVIELREAFADAGIPLELLPGAEVALDWIGRIEPARFGLGGNPRYLLVEFPYYGWPLELTMQVSRLLASGVTPVLAHPERNTEVQASPTRLDGLVGAGVLVQVTAASLDGRLGRGSRACGFKLLELGFAHLLASDAHAATIRGIGMSAAVQAIDDPMLSRWLSYDVPAAIIADTPLPPAPTPRRRAKRRWLSRR